LICSLFKKKKLNVPFLKDERAELEHTGHFVMCSIFSSSPFISVAENNLEPEVDLFLLSKIYEFLTLIGFKVNNKKDQKNWGTSAAIQYSIDFWMSE